MYSLEGNEDPKNSLKWASTGSGRGRNAGNRNTGAVLKAETEVTKKYFVSTAGHSKLQKKNTWENLGDFQRGVFARGGNLNNWGGRAHRLQ